MAQRRGEGTAAPGPRGGPGRGDAQLPGGAPRPAGVRPGDRVLLPDQRPVRGELLAADDPEGERAHRHRQDRPVLGAAVRVRDRADGRAGAALDRTGERRLHSSITALISVVALAVAAFTASSFAVSLIAIVVATACMWRRTRCSGRCRRRT
ncbi:hypothetical protein FDZ84_17270 [Saccharopolyspora sp. ASAGF58]|nr:hypothetical protein FDZ84_17270 [Saccharopolyspora sp. ASAGF58]